MTKKVLCFTAAAVVFLISGCSDKTSESSFESLCLSEMMKDENMKANPHGEAMAQEICSCSAPSFGKMSEQSKTEFMQMAQSGEDGHLSNEKDEKMLATAMASCAMQSVAKLMQAGGQ
ncbi:MAG: hypothetical protein P8Y65_03175 [Campylobacterales bacterium]